jgi:hypothetical protein
VNVPQKTSAPKSGKTVLSDRTNRHSTPERPSLETYGLKQLEEFQRRLRERHISVAKNKEN